MPARALAVLVGLLVALVALPEAAQASQLLARNTSTERLAVSRSGRALVTYHAAGRAQRLLAWGAIDARLPSPSRRQVEFRVDYSGGWGSSRDAVWKTFRNACGRYRGPALPFLVTACTAPDGSHWALQRWQRSQANFGVPPWKAGHGAWELRLSHWRGEAARLEVWLDWSYGGRWHHLFGRLTYQGGGIYGFSSTPNGEPTDSHGRVISVDTFDSPYGPGWKRENGFLARRPDGTFCYVFVPHRAPSGELRPPGVGERYRVSTNGPGVTPDVSWEGPALHDFRRGNPEDEAYEARMNALQQELTRGAKPCHA